MVQRQLFDKSRRRSPLLAPKVTLAKSYCILIAPRFERCLTEADSTFIVVIQVHPDFASPRNTFGSWCRQGEFIFPYTSFASVIGLF
jgi:hypothetical protein